ncbi:hypothetical protein HMP09_2637 [Sphingomonas sp. HMP9]|uniref:outer membrane beta-barrel protein n=1 Tax=Sphingomonas sp. HMP9 TaxID=1517554 RepID=UPI001596ADA6|nr:outer membrane beta-barrel protein [Sphingomonas sp. HMP9]BCA63403.1 hypothetical protein HMP09_2637 [Sphingomonas sp. HMP9]
MTTRLWAAAVLMPPAVVLPKAACAQVEEGLVVQPTIPQDFGRDRNVSVQQQSRPDYTQLGVPLGGVTFFPSIDIGTGATSNTYNTSSNHIAAPFLYQQGSARLVSGWSRHLLQVSGTTTHREYVGEPQRNEHLWNFSAVGRLDVYHSVKIDGEVSIARKAENSFSGEVSPIVAALSRYRRDAASLKASYTQGRGRAFVLFDYSDFAFAPIPLRAGGELDQSQRDRQVTRLTAQFEYARTPSVSLFVQIGGGRTYFDQLLQSGLPNVDSRAVRFLSGVNVDIAGRIRGTIGVGYGIRDFDAGIYRTVRGFSFETQLEAFPTRRLTLGMTGRRSIEDATVGSFNPYLNTSLTVRSDYEVLRNMILSATGDLSHLSFQISRNTTNFYSASVGARLLLSRRLSLRGG